VRAASRNCASAKRTWLIEVADAAAS
jgi:hypothetical protein